MASAPAGSIQITNAGLGCDHNQCIWISGSGFGTNCSVSLYAGDWSNGANPEATITLSSQSGLVCTDQLVTFEIPQSVRDKFATVNITVVNNSQIGIGQWWTNPYALSINAIGLLHFNGENMAQYYTLGQRRAGLLVGQNDGAKYSQWATVPVSSTRTDFVWGDPNQWPAPAGQASSVEEWEIKSNCAAGKKFLWTNAYRSDYPSASYRFQIVTTRAEIQVGGTVSDITGGGSCGTMGQPYMLLDVSTDAYIIRVWGNILNADGQTVGEKFFWQAQYAYMPSVTNSCWRSDQINTRPAIVQWESWWDSANGWTIGSGSMGADGVPDGKSVTLGRWQMIGQGVGDGWLEDNAGANFCMQYQWQY